MISVTYLADCKGAEKFGTCVSLWNLFDMIKWIIVPEAMTVQYILNMMK